MGKESEKKKKKVFPGGSVVRNPPVNAGDNAGFDPWLGEIP